MTELQCIHVIIYATKNLFIHSHLLLILFFISIRSATRSQNKKVIHEHNVCI